MPRAPRDKRRSEILDAVVRVIIDVGFTSMRVADVARVAGVSTALVHYHFTTKHDLIVAALESACEADRELRNRVADGPGTALARLDGVLVGSLPRDADDESWLLWIESWGESRRNEAIRDLMATLEVDEIAVSRRLIAEGVAAAEFECPDAYGTAARLSALRDGLTIDQTLYRTSPAPGRYAELMRDGIRHELGLTPAAYNMLLRAG